MNHDQLTHSAHSSPPAHCPPARSPARPLTRQHPPPATCSSVTGRTLRLLYTLLPNGALTGALVADVGSGEYAGLSFGTPHRASSKTVILTRAFVGK